MTESSSSAAECDFCMSFRSCSLKPNLCWRTVWLRLKGRWATPGVMLPNLPVCWEMPRETLRCEGTLGVVLPHVPVLWAMLWTMLCCECTALTVLALRSGTEVAEITSSANCLRRFGRYVRKVPVVKKSTADMPSPAYIPLATLYVKGWNTAHKNAGRAS